MIYTVCTLRFESMGLNIYRFKDSQQTSARTQMHRCFSIQFPSYYFVLDIDVAHERSISRALFIRLVKLFASRNNKVQIDFEIHLYVTCLPRTLDEMTLIIYTLHHPLTYVDNRTTNSRKEN